MRTYNVAYRRKRERKTNYGKRLSLLKANLSRLVIRKTNKHTYAQIIEYKENGDKIVAQASSKELLKLGWKGSSSNLSAAYLVGALIAKRTKIKEVILDLGLQNPKSGSKLYAALKGAVDNGLSVRYSESTLPSEDRIHGNHLTKKTNFTEVLKKVTGK